MGGNCDAATRVFEGSAYLEALPSKTRVAASPKQELNAIGLSLSPIIPRLRPVQPARRDGVPRQLPAQSHRRTALAVPDARLLSHDLQPHVEHRGLERAA